MTASPHFGYRPAAEALMTNWSVHIFTVAPRRAAVKGSADGLAAVDDERRTDRERGVVAEQERDGGRLLLRRAVAPERDGGEECRVTVLDAAVVLERGHHPALH